jgi:hypothetical protein
MAAWIGGAGPLDLVSANAGVGSGAIVGAPETGEEARRILATNGAGCPSAYLLYPPQTERLDRPGCTASALGLYGTF